jgi:hypothetical protein
MKIFCSLLVATLPFGSVLAAAPKSKNVKVTQCASRSCQTFPARASRACSSNTAPAAAHPVTRIPNSPFPMRPCLRERSAVRSMTDREDLRGRTKLLRAAGQPPRRSANASTRKATKLLAVLVWWFDETRSRPVTIRAHKDGIRTACSSTTTRPSTGARAWPWRSSAGQGCCIERS